MHQESEDTQNNLKTVWQRNIRLVFVIRGLFSMLFIVPVITLYWKKYGMDVLDIFWLQAIFALFVVLLEVPTGYLGDKLGRKKTLMLGAGWAALSWALYATANAYWQFVLMELSLGVAFSLLSGTDTSLLFESLKEMYRERDFTKEAGRMASLMHLAEGSAAVAGGFLAVVLAYEWLFVFTGLAAVGGFLAAIALREPHREVYAHPRGQLYSLYKIAQFVFLRSKRVRYVVPLMAVASLATMLGVWLYQPFWEARDVPLWLFGILWAGMSLPAALSSHLAHRWEDKLGRRLALWLLPLPVLLGYGGAALLPGYLGVACIYFVPLLRGFAMPVLSRYIHEETFSDKRATVMSIQSWLFRLLYFVIGPLVGLIGRDVSLEAAFLFNAIFSLVTIVAFTVLLLRRVDVNALPE